MSGYPESLSGIATAIKTPQLGLWRVHTPRHNGYL